MFDALCHLSLFPSPAEARAHLEQAARDGVTDVMSAGTDPTIDEPVPVDTVVHVHRALGVHPERASDERRADQIRALEERATGARAIGECGLDNRSGQPPLDVQERTLRAQLVVARAHGLPVILHLVGAWARALDVLDEDVAAHGPLPAGGVWHAFGGPKEAVVRAERLGLALSIGGLVLNPHARRLQEALPEIAPELLLVETDAPHQPPVRLRDVVSQLAALLRVPAEDVAARTSQNSRRIYRVSPRGEAG